MTILDLSRVYLFLLAVAYFDVTPHHEEHGDGEEEEGSEPDLSWLPDPDLLYGEEERDGEGGKEVEGVDEEVAGADEEVVVKEGKRKKVDNESEEEPAKGEAQEGSAQGEDAAGDD